jgi:acetyl esterase
MQPRSVDVFPGQELTDEMRAAVSIAEASAPGPPGSPNVRVLLYRPKRESGRLPLIVHMHGGAFARRADNFPAIDARLAMLGALVTSVDYRSLPAHHFPAAPEDCYAALCWAVGALDIDPRRVVVTGGSAGGALAAATTLMARDRAGPAIALQALYVPVLDDQCTTTSMQQFVVAPVFGADQAKAMWAAYLGSEANRSLVSPYAAPARAESLAGLPPAFIQVGGLDPLRDEGLQYAMRLMEHGIPVELYCAPGQHHGRSDDPRTATLAASLYHQAIAAAIS